MKSPQEGSSLFINEISQVACENIYQNEVVWRQAVLLKTLLSHRIVKGILILYQIMKILKIPVPSKKVLSTPYILHRTC